MAKLFEIIEKIEKTAPLALAESWDNPGLMLGRRDKEVHKVLTALDMDVNVAREAVKIGADLVLTHHPMIFHPLKNVTEDGGCGECILILAKNDIAVYSAHTNLDSASGGINDYLAQLYNLKNVTSIPVTEDSKNTGLMRVGELDGEKKELEWGHLMGSGVTQADLPQTPQSHNVDSLIAKIAELEAEEAKEKKATTLDAEASSIGEEEDIPMIDIDGLLAGLGNDSKTHSEESTQMSSLMDAIMKRRDGINISDEE